MRNKRLKLTMTDQSLKKEIENQNIRNKERVEVRQSDLGGRGLFAKKKIFSGQVIVEETSDISLLYKEVNENLRNEKINDDKFKYPANFFDKHTLQDGLKSTAGEWKTKSTIEVAKGDDGAFDFQDIRTFDVSNEQGTDYNVAVPRWIEFLNHQRYLPWDLALRFKKGINAVLSETPIVKDGKVTLTFVALRAIEKDEEIFINYEQQKNFKITKDQVFREEFVFAVNYMREWNVCEMLEPNQFNYNVRRLCLGFTDKTIDAMIEKIKKSKYLQISAIDGWDGTIRKPILYGDANECQGTRDNYATYVEKGTNKPTDKLKQAMDANTGLDKYYEKEERLQDLKNMSNFNKYELKQKYFQDNVFGKLSKKDWQNENYYNERIARLCLIEGLIQSAQKDEEKEMKSDADSNTGDVRKNINIERYKIAKKIHTGTSDTSNGDDDPIIQEYEIIEFGTGTFTKSQFMEKLMVDGVDTKRNVAIKVVHKSKNYYFVPVTNLKAGLLSYVVKKAKKTRKWNLNMEVDNNESIANDTKNWHLLNILDVVENGGKLTVKRYFFRSWMALDMCKKKKIQ